MGTEQRYDIHDLFLGFPAPLVDRPRRREIGERMGRDGERALARPARTCRGGGFGDGGARRRGAGALSQDSEDPVEGPRPGTASRALRPSRTVHWN